MDNYPPHLAPEFDEGGAVSTPFEVWWPRVKSAFPRVPEEVARYWLHEHWSHSPFSWLPSDRYDFALVDFPSGRLSEIRSGWANFQDNGECLDHGRYLVEEHHPTWGNRTVAFMLEHGAFPSPIIVLDNRDGHLVPPKGSLNIPKSLVLIEGHRRLNVGLYLASRGDLKPTVKIYLMSVRSGWASKSTDGSDPSARGCGGSIRPSLT